LSVGILRLCVTTSHVIFFRVSDLAVAFVAASRRGTRPRVSARRMIHRLTM
jgi:hypothetical protein